MSDTIEKLQKELDRINRVNARMIEFIRSVQWCGKIERFLKSIERSNKPS